MTALSSSNMDCKGVYSYKTALFVAFFKMYLIITTLFLI